MAFTRRLLLARGLGIAAADRLMDLGVFLLDTLQIGDLAV